MAPPPRQALARMQRMPDAPDLRTLGTALTRVALRNFKGHEDLRLDMGKITVLIGPTNSGKSTVLQALNLLNSALHAGSLGILQGGSQEYGHFADIVTRRNEGEDVGIDIGGRRIVHTEEGPNVIADFSYAMSFDSLLRPGDVRTTVDMQHNPPRPEDDDMRLEYAHDSNAGDRATVSGPGAAGISRTHVQSGNTLAPGIRIDPEDRPAVRTFNEMFRNGRFFQSLLGELWHVPFSRVVTTYTLPLEYSESILSPNRARGTASLLSHISTAPPIQEKISSMMREVGFKRIVTRNVPTSKDKRPVLALDFVRGDTLNSIVHEGSGLNQLVSMLAVLAYSPRGSIITIEEPEIHLDPAAQARLMGILVKQVTEEDKQIIFTTHSDHLLYPLLAYVAKDECPIAGRDVAMHYFNTDESGNLAGAERLNINEHGQIPGGLRGFWYADGRAISEILG